MLHDTFHSPSTCSVKEWMSISFITHAYPSWESDESYVDYPCRVGEAVLHGFSSISPFRFSGLAGAGFRIVSKRLLSGPRRAREDSHR